MISLLAGIIAGFVLAIPPGPVATYTIHTTLTNGKRSGLGIGIGVALVDMFFCLLVLFASTALFGQVESLVQEHPYISFATKLLIIGAIIIYSLIQLRSSSLPSSSPRIHLEEKVHSSKPIIIGSATALSNAFNPTFLPSLMATISTVTAQLPVSASPLLDKVLFIFGFGAGTYGWLHGLVTIVARHHAKISAPTMLLIRRISAIVLLVFGLYLAWKMFS